MENNVPAQLVKPVVAAAVSYNNSVIVRSKIVIGLVLGVMAGLFGLEGLVGIGFFIVGYAAAILQMSLYLGANKAKFGAENKILATTGLGSSLSAFALSWVLLFNFI